jgi:hypothetical protein
MRSLRGSRGIFLAALAASVLDCGPRDAGAPAAHAGLPFIENDYPRAIAEARSRALPLFVEAWTPW